LILRYREHYSIAIPGRVLSVADLDSVPLALSGISRV